MSRVFSPEDDFKWHDLACLPRVGQLFFSLAQDLAGEDLSPEIDVLIIGKNPLGELQIQPLPAGYRPNPLSMLEHISKIKNYRATRKIASKQNVIAVSRLTGNTLQTIHRRVDPASVLPHQAEAIRSRAKMIHYRIGQGYLSIVDPGYSDRNQLIVQDFRAIGEEINGASGV